MADLSNIKRNPLAADTEPTDKELSEVMREARDLAMARKRSPMRGCAASWLKLLRMPAPEMAWQHHANGYGIARKIKEKPHAIR